GAHGVPLGIVRLDANLLAEREPVGIARTEPGALRVRVERDGGVHVGVADERARQRIEVGTAPELLGRKCRVFGLGAAGDQQPERDDQPRASRPYTLRSRRAAPQDVTRPGAPAGVSPRAPICYLPPV